MLLRIGPPGDRRESRRPGIPAHSSRAESDDESAIRDGVHRGRLCCEHRWLVEADRCDKRANQDPLGTAAMAASGSMPPTVLTVLAEGRKSGGRRPRPNQSRPPPRVRPSPTPRRTERPVQPLGVAHQQATDEPSPQPTRPESASARITKSTAQGVGVGPVQPSYPIADSSGAEAIRAPGRGYLE